MFYVALVFYLMIILASLVIALVLAALALEMLYRMMLDFFHAIWEAIHGRE